MKVDGIPCKFITYPPDDNSETKNMAHEIFKMEDIVPQGEE